MIAQRLLRTGLIVIVILGLNKVTGFVKLLLMSGTFGAGPVADAFAAANQLPELFDAMLVGGALGAALIPVYSAYLSQAKFAQASALASSVLTLALIVLGGICGLAAFFAPWITRTLLVPDFPPQSQALTAELMRILLLAVTIFGVGSVLSSLLNAHQHFLTPAIGTVAIDSGQILGLYFLAPIWGIHGVAWGSVIGALLLVLVQLPAFFHYRIGYRPQIGIYSAGLRAMGHLVWPRVITLGAGQAVDLVLIRLASQLPAGAISAYFYALLIMVYMPKTLFGTAISTVVFPTLAEQYNAGEPEKLQRTVTQAVCTVWALIIPGAIGLVALGKPAVAFLLQRGSFDAEATTVVYALFGILAVRLVAEATQDIVALPFYARHNTRTPMWATLGWMVLNIGLSLLFVGRWGIQGLAWATSLAAVALAMALYLLNQATAAKLDSAVFGAVLLRTLLASAGMGIIIRILAGLELEPVLFLPLAISSGTLAYGLIYFLLGGRDVFLLLASLLPGHRIAAGKRRHT